MKKKVSSEKIIRNRRIEVRNTIYILSKHTHHESVTAVVLAQREIDIKKQRRRVEESILKILLGGFGGWGLVVVWGGGGVVVLGEGEDAKGGTYSPEESKSIQKSSGGRTTVLARRNGATKNWLRHTLGNGGGKKGGIRWKLARTVHPNPTGLSVTGHLGQCEGAVFYRCLKGKSKR